MPIENEFKYVLRYDPEMPRLLGTRTRLEQGYLTEDSRIRAMTKKDGSTTYWFTFKKWTHQGLVEIEPEISKEDFDRLWPLTISRLCKTRYSFEESGAWDVDFFGDETQPYFVLGEVEVPEGATEPAVAGRLAPYLIKAVGKDPEFTSYRLSIERHAKSLMERLLAE